MNNQVENNSKEIIFCTKSKTELFTINKWGNIILINGCGECIKCGLIFHESFLYIPKGVEPCRWPIFYEGRYCKSCWNED